MNSVDGTGDLLSELKFALKKIKRQETFKGTEESKSGKINTVENEEDKDDNTNGYHENKSSVECDAQDTNNKLPGKLFTPNDLELGSTVERRTSFQNCRKQFERQSDYNEGLCKQDRVRADGSSKLSNHDGLHVDIAQDIVIPAPDYNESHEITDGSSFTYSSSRKPSFNSSCGSENFSNNNRVLASNLSSPCRGLNVKSQDQQQRQDVINKGWSYTHQNKSSDNEKLTNGTMDSNKISVKGSYRNNSTKNVFNKVNLTSPSLSMQHQEYETPQISNNHDDHLPSKNHDENSNSLVENNISTKEDINAETQKQQDYNEQIENTDNSLFPALRPVNKKKTKDDLYQELNCVLKQRNTKVSSLNVDEIERMKSGKSILYFGSSAQKRGQPGINANNDDYESPRMRRNKQITQEQSVNCSVDKSDDAGIKSCLSKFEKLSDNRSKHKMTNAGSNNNEKVLYKKKPPIPIPPRPPASKTHKTNGLSGKDPGMYKSVTNLNEIGLENKDEHEKEPINNCDNETICDKMKDDFDDMKLTKVKPSEMHKLNMNKSVRRCVDFDKKLKLIGEKLKGGFPCPEGAMTQNANHQEIQDTAKLNTSKSVPLFTSQLHYEEADIYNSDNEKIGGHSAFHDSAMSIGSSHSKQSPQPASLSPKHKAHSVDNLQTESFKSLQQMLSASLSSLVPNSDTSNRQQGCDLMKKSEEAHYKDSGFAFDTNLCEYHDKDTKDVVHAKFTIDSSYEDETPNDSDLKSNQFSTSLNQYSIPTSCSIDIPAEKNTSRNSPRSTSPHPGHLVSQLVESMRDTLENNDLASQHFKGLSLSEVSSGISDTTINEDKDLINQEHSSEYTDVLASAVKPPRIEKKNSPHQQSSHFCKLSDGSIKTSDTYVGGHIRSPAKGKGLNSDMSLTTVTSCDNSTTTTDDYYSGTHRTSRDNLSASHSPQQIHEQYSNSATSQDAKHKKHIYVSSDYADSTCYPRFSVSCKNTGHEKPKNTRSKSLEAFCHLDTEAKKQARGLDPYVYYSEDEAFLRSDSIDDHMALQKHSGSRKTPSGASKNDTDIITRLMITHSGDRIPPEGAESDTTPHHNNRIVTVPEPTSFHMESNKVGRQLLKKADQTIQVSQMQNRTSNRNKSPVGYYQTPAMSSSNKGTDTEKRRYLRHNSLDKEQQRQLLYHTWSSNVARKVSRHKSSFTRRQYHSGSSQRLLLSGDESDSSTGTQSLKSWEKMLDIYPTRYEKVKVSPRIKKSPRQYSRSVSPAENKVRGHNRQESVHSVSTFIMDYHEHSSDADTESLYNNDCEPDVEQSLNYDSGRASAELYTHLERQQLRLSNGLFKRLACCFMCKSHMSTISSSTQISKSRCPITQTIMDTTSALAYGDGLTKGYKDVQSAFVVDSKGHRGELTVEVEGPNSLAKCRQQPTGQGQYNITYTPVEVGEYAVYVRWNGRDIDGSPFRPLVVDPRKLIVVGGWDKHMDANHRMDLTVGQLKRIEFDSSHAGPGQLTAELRGPDNNIVTTQIENIGTTTQILSFTPRMEGDHTLNLLWAGYSVPGSPILGTATSGGMTMNAGRGPVNHEKVVLTGRGLKEAIVHQDAEFVIDGTDAGQGAPDVKLTGVKTDIHVQVVPLGERKYRCVYNPQLAGAYLLNIMWADRQVRGSPFKVNVIAHSDASKVVCTGDGLKTGILGKEIKSLIDTRQAGPGELTAHCMGPTKVAFCELYDHRNGTFELNVRPQEAGRHVLQIKYGGEHVPGSPYVLKVSSAPDASKVRVSGPGIEHGILATYQSRFICETRGAGAGQLTVRIRGPKGAFRVEMQRESQKDRTILCRYDPTEVGDYIISVKWSNVDVPGSPFHIQIFDTQDELDRFMQDNPSRRQNAINFPPRSTGGWAEDI